MDTDHAADLHTSVAELLRIVDAGPRVAPTVITIFSLVFAITLFGVATGVHATQSWLERWSHDKHVGD